MSQKTLRIKQTDNTREILKVLHAAFHRYKNELIPSSALAETTSTIEENLRNGIEILGAYVCNELVGIVKVATIQDRLYFSRLSVLPSHQQMGIASALVNQVETLAADRNLTSVQCKVRKSEQGNIRFYEKLSYKIISEELTISPTGFRIETVTMEKVL